VTFNHAVTAVTEISSGGYFQVEERTPQGRRRLEIKPGVASGNGGLEYSYFVDGDRHDYDAQARAWFASFLLGLERQSAFAAEVKVPELLRHGGVNAVLAEISNIT